MSVNAYLGVGNLKRAAEIYRKAVLDDPLSADPALEEKLQPYIKGLSDTPDVHDDRVKVTLENWVPQSNLPVERSRIAFKDVGGMEQLKEEIQIKIIHPLNHPEIYKAYGKSIGGGILLYGAPGCGKTYLARATAGEVNAFFLNIGIHDVLNMYLGQSEQNLHKLFELARRYKPCVIFIDEIDALGANRADMQHSAGRYTINQLLAELDGVGASNDGILILAATNAPWHIDPALRRAGRFDQVIFVPPPDAPARSAILEVMLRDKPTQQLDLRQIAKHTAGFSGADLKAVVDRAIEDKLRDALKRGVPSPLQTDDLIRATKMVKPSTKDWFATARNYAIYSNQSGIYDDVIAYLDKNDGSNPLSKFAFWRDE
jgi:SpoVK/Ycf46/Vps4 family AAA+-type ATPase